MLGRGKKDKPADSPVMVRTYKKPKEYERDAQKLAKDGWRPSSTVERKIPGYWTHGQLFGSPKELVVTYQKQ